MPRGSAQAPVVDASNLRQPVSIAEGWVVRAGDDPAWASPGYDDSRWTHFNAQTPLYTVFPNQRPSVVWYRLHLKVAPRDAGILLVPLLLGFERAAEMSTEAAGKIVQAAQAFGQADDITVVTVMRGAEDEVSLDLPVRLRPVGVLS